MAMLQITGGYINLPYRRMSDSMSTYVNPGLLTNVNHTWFYFKKEFPAK